MTGDIVVIGHDGREETLSGFEDEHTMEDLRDYWEEHFAHIDWPKNTGEADKAVKLGKGEAVPWADVKDETLGDLDMDTHQTIQLAVSHIVG